MLGPIREAVSTTSTRNSRYVGAAIASWALGETEPTFDRLPSRLVTDEWITILRR